MVLTFGSLSSTSIGLFRPPRCTPPPLTGAHAPPQPPASPPPSGDETMPSREEAAPDGWWLGGLVVARGAQKYTVRDHETYPKIASQSHAQHCRRARDGGTRRRPEKAAREGGMRESAAPWQDVWAHPRCCAAALSSTYDFRLCFGVRGRFCRFEQNTRQHVSTKLRLVQCSGLGLYRFHIAPHSANHEKGHLTEFDVHDRTYYHKSH